MTQIALALAAATWGLEALVLGGAMGRWGYDMRKWTAVGLIFGPVGTAIGLGVALRSRPRKPEVLHAGHHRDGPVDVLVGLDGSPEARAGLDRAATLFGATAGRMTVARVLPLDAPPETERLARTQLASASARYPELDPSLVILRGEPVAALRDYANCLGYEVLVVGTRGHGKARARLGSVATSLARGAGLSVVLVDDPPVDH